MKVNFKPNLILQNQPIYVKFNQFNKVKFISIFMYI